nr:hypothetical protein [Tanacetum cinerariifolium]
RNTISSIKFISAAGGFCRDKSQILYRRIGSFIDDTICGAFVDAIGGGGDG